MTADELRNRFSHHPPTEAQVESYELVRAEIKATAVAIQEICPEGREKALAFTHLEQTMFYANAAIARAKAPESDS